MLGWRKELKTAVKFWRLGTAHKHKFSLDGGYLNILFNLFDSAGFKLQPGGEGQSV